ncbi:unnamed protein product [Mytilus coruscus]|uniref:Uncharacterized protein n=1 Tax=Mytilus coruscus TaxID=42192 RepID=A0A6J8CJY0_MYTCO|nr:unnamed protein product [Mytilus coruscus]
MLEEKLKNQQNSIASTIEQTMEMLSNTAMKCPAKKTYWKNKLKLKLWNPEVKHTLHQNKIAYKNCKNAERPNDPEHPLVINKKETRKLFITELRKEENKRKHIERDRIITANTQNKRLFYKLIKKQRNNKNIFINDLHNSTYDSKHQKLCDVDYQAIKYLCDQALPRTVTKSELLEAIKSINTGKSEDIFDINPAIWSIIDELHKNTSCSIKWKNQLSQEFKVYQGVKQGGLLSADLYKPDIEDLLSLYENLAQGCKIGNININAVACAYDIALLSDNPYDLQILVNLALQYSQLHHYTLQPHKKCHYSSREQSKENS